MRLFRAVPRIAPAGPALVPALAELYARSAAAAELDRHEVEAWFAGGFEVYEAVHEGRLVGAARICFPAGACNLDRLVVAPDARGRGFGRVIAEHLIRRAHRAGVSRVWAQAPADAEDQRGLYQGLGFRSLGVVRPHLGPRRALVLYELPV